MATTEKPYRLYRGGRKKGNVPLQRRSRTTPPGGEPSAPGRRRWWLWAAGAALGLVLLAVVWTALGYRSFSQGVNDANKRIPARVRAQLAKDDRSVLSEPTVTLVIGTDGGKGAGRQGSRRSDSLMLMRSDPGHHRISYLSIPRDLRVDIPGYGTSKINAANQVGGPALTIATVRALTGLRVDHVVVVDFQGFRKLIDAIGGIEITVPKPILSNPFDCPHPPKRCKTWDGWRFGKGRQHMDGRHALAYSRIRENRLDPSETDITRTERQQAVIDAVGHKIASFGTFVRLPFMGHSLASPLATDLSAWQLSQLGWVRFRAGDSLRCRLGGDPATIGGESYLLGSENNASVVAMFLGRSAPLPAPKGQPYAPGCRRGS
jgi:LCP family protein required for cell wall assembly